MLFHLYDMRFLKNLLYIFPFSQSTISFAHKKTAIPLHQTDVIKSCQIAEQLATMRFAGESAIHGTHKFLCYQRCQQPFTFYATNWNLKTCELKNPNWNQTCSKLCTLSQFSFEHLKWSLKSLNLNWIFSKKLWNKET